MDFPLAFRIFLLAMMSSHTITAAEEIYNMKSDKGDDIVRQNATYCSGSSTQKPEACRPNMLFPGATAIDAVLRSRMSAPGPFDGGLRSTDPNIPGFMADGKLEWTHANKYVLYQKTLKATAQIDHILCKDEKCQSFFDIYWRTNFSILNPVDDKDLPGQLLVRYSMLSGTDKVLPIWSPGKSAVEVECSQEELAPHPLSHAQARRCTWEPPKQEVDVPGKPKFLLPQEAVAGLGGFSVDRDQVSLMKVGNFMEQNTSTCIRLIVPINAAMEQLGWMNASDGCTSPQSTFLFTTYFMPAYSSDSPGQSRGLPPATTFLEMKKNFNEARNSKQYRMAQSVLRCWNGTNKRPGWNQKRFCTTFDPALGSVGTLLFVNNRPIWAINVTQDIGDGSPNLHGANDSFSTWLYQSSAAVLLKPWCNKPNSTGGTWVPMVNIDGKDTSVFDCSMTERRGLLQMNTTGGEELKDLWTAFVQGPPLNVSTAFLDSSTQEHRKLKTTINAMITNVAYDLHTRGLGALASCDTTATTFGSCVNLIITILSSIITFLGIADALRACKELADKFRLSHIFAATVVSLATAAALLLPPTAFLIQEVWSSDQNYKGDEAEICWFRERINLDEDLYSSSMYIATIVSITFKSFESPVAQPLGWITLVIGAVAFLCALHRIWQEQLPWLTGDSYVQKEPYVKEVIPSEV